MCLDCSASERQGDCISHISNHVSLKFGLADRESRSEGQEQGAGSKCESRVKTVHLQGSLPINQRSLECFWFTHVKGSKADITYTTYFSLGVIGPLSPGLPCRLGKAFDPFASYILLSTSADKRR